MEEIFLCKCRKEITRGHASVSNWMRKKNGEYVCGECQGLSDYPGTITTYGLGGKPAMIIKIKKHN